MDTRWIVTANAGKARFFFQANPTSSMQEIEDMLNVAARQHAADIDTDDLGQRSASKSGHSTAAPTTPNGYQPNQTPVEHQVELFARHVADALSQGYAEARFKQVILIASPEFLGILRKLLDPKIAAIVELEISKDYTQLDNEKLREQIDAYEKSRQ